MNRLIPLVASVLGVAAVGTVAWANLGGEQLSPGAKADLVTVEKAERRLTLWAGGHPLKTYRVALGGNPVGTKHREGDQKTPEGRYLLDWRNPKSSFHLSLHVSYPSAADAAAAASAGVPPGGDIMVHGLPNGRGWIGRLHRWKDWTAGCVAVTNSEIEEIWAAVADGTPIEIKA